MRGILALKMSCAPVTMVGGSIDYRVSAAGTYNWKPTPVPHEESSENVGHPPGHTGVWRLADGAHLGTVGKLDCSAGDGEGQLSQPAGLCVAAGALYVCDSQNHRIVVLGTDLSWRYTFGRKGRGGGEFANPTAVAAHGDELYVVDTCNHRVQVFSRDRRERMYFARAIGGFGVAPGQFWYPMGVANAQEAPSIRIMDSCFSCNTSLPAMVFEGRK